MQAKAAVYESGTLRPPSESTQFGKLANNLQMALHDVMHPDYEIDPRCLELGEVLGEGEFGVVHRGKWHGTPVAVKVLHTHKRIRIEELACEIAALLRTHHPNTVQLLGAATQQEPYIIVTEILDGGSLDSALRGGAKFSLRRALEVALDCARGLEYLHLPTPTSLIHRDLKPSNVMFSGPRVAMSEREMALDTGVAKITDFGLSKALNPGARPRGPEHLGGLQNGRFVSVVPSEAAAEAVASVASDTEDEGAPSLQPCTQLACNVGAQAWAERTRLLQGRTRGTQ